MKNLTLYVSLAITTLTGCLDPGPEAADDLASHGGKADGADDPEDFSYYGVSKQCTGTACTWSASMVNSDETVAIDGVYWPRTYTDTDLQRIGDSLYGDRVIVRGALRPVEPPSTTSRTLAATETWVAVTSGFVPGTPIFATLQPVRTFCPVEPCAAKYAQGALNGDRLDDVEADLTKLFAPADELAAIQAQLDDTGIIALGEEQTDASGAKRFVVNRAYLQIP